MGSPSRLTMNEKARPRRPVFDTSGTFTPARGRCHACQGDFRNCRQRAIDPADERMSSKAE